MISLCNRPCPGAIICIVNTVSIACEGSPYCIDDDRSIAHTECRLFRYVGQQLQIDICSRLFSFPVATLKHVMLALLATHTRSVIEDGHIISVALHSGDDENGERISFLFWFL